MSIISVKSAPYSAVGDGVTDDRAAIQSAIDAAFGSSGSPHGVTNASLNQAVYFPAGVYKIGSPGLTLTDVYGAKIFGAGISASVLQLPANAAHSAITTNGCKYCAFYDFQVSNPDGTSITSYAFDLDWGGSGSVGLGNNLFFNFAASARLSASGGGLRIAHSGNGGANNQFIFCGFGGNPGLLVEGASAYNQLVQGGGSGGLNPMKCTGGSIHLDSCAFASESTGDAVYISSTSPCVINACRTEQVTPAVFLRAVGARIIVAACNSSDASGIGKVAVLSSSASVIFDGNSLSTLAAGGISGTAGCKVYDRGNNFASDVYTGYTGTISQGPI